MNYQYIEQLIERYFACETTLQEEQILRSFFQQEDVPGQLRQYAALFRYEAEAQHDTLGEDFDEKILSLIAHDEPKATAKVISLSRLLAPFGKAAAVVAIAITIGTATEHAVGVQNAEDAASDAGAVAIDPYIKSGDIRSTLHVKDVNKAEIKVTQDSLIGVPVDNDAN